MLQGRLSTRWMFVALCAAVASLGGCGQEVVNFNNSMAKLEDKLEKPLENLLSHFESFGNSKSANITKAEEDYKTLVTSLDEITAEAKGIQVIDAKMAKEFHAAYLNYYAEIKQVVTTEVRQGLDLLKDPAMKEDEKVTKWQALAIQMATKLQATTTKLQNVQQQFASAHNMRLEK